MTESTSSQPHDDLVERLVAECLERISHGDDDPLEALCATHPTHADELRRRHAGLVQMGLWSRSDNNEPLQIGNFRLLRELGRGGMGVVYRATDLRLHREVAIKVLDPELAPDNDRRRRLIGEARTVARIDHPNVATILELGEADGQPFVAMELVRGSNMRALLRDGPMGPHRAVKLMTDVCRGLASAHELGIIHRDLKPENIIYDPQTHATKLLDFGIARDADSDPAERLTKTGFFVGTLNYVAPEALSGELVGEPADIYSLATITYYLLSGQHPYTGRSPRELFQQLLTQPPVPLNKAGMGHHFPDALQEVVMRALERDPASRQQPVRRFADEFAAAASAQSGAGPVPVAATTKEEPKQGLMGTFRSLFGKKG